MSYKKYKVRVYKSGHEEWRNVNGKLHRENGPAVIWVDGTEEYYLNGKLHREDGPAVVWADGTQVYWVNGKRHREDGPAYIWPNGRQEYYLNGKRHREDGPAYIGADGTQEYWVNGEELSKEEFEGRTKEQKENCDGEIVKIKGKKYKLSLVQ